MIDDLSGLDLGYLASLGLVPKNSSLALDRSSRIDLAILAVTYGAPISSVVEEMNWKDFEVFVARILAENDYECVQSYRRRGDSETKGMEIDVVGVRGNRIVTVDAKLWGLRGGKGAALQYAAQKQRERSVRLAEELRLLSKKLPGLKSQEYYVFSILVTWLVEEVELHDGVPVVPVFKFNSFVVNMDQYEDLMDRHIGSL